MRRTRQWPALTIGIGWLVLATCLGPVTVLAQNAPPGPVIDLAGEWAAQVHEDAIYRGAGGFLGDYTGLPINAAARQMAESWDADVLSQPERQTQAHPAQYAMRGEGPNIRISEVRDPVTDRLIALKTCRRVRPCRSHDLARRPAAPSEHAEHTWAGFSTGTFHDGELTVTTTHMKLGVIQKVGVYTSPYSVMTEHFFRHGTLSDEGHHDRGSDLSRRAVHPQQTWVLNPNQNVAQALPWEPVDELVGKAVGWVPHYPLGTRHTEPAEKYGIPFDATQGGANTTYPEYQITIERMRAKP